MSSLTKPRDDKEPLNPALRLYGRRFHKDQTPLEYLAEFLLVFASKKGTNQTDSFRFNLDDDTDSLYYWPEDRIALKLFSFFPSSKLSTRHPVHQKAYKEAIIELKNNIKASPESKEETVKLLQSLLTGFIGVSGDRTWTTNTFFPASTALLAREVDWLHTKAKKAEIKEWGNTGNYFALDRHNFMARGGEVLFLQIVYLFSPEGQSELNTRLSDRYEYDHLSELRNDLLKNDLETELSEILLEDVEDLQDIVDFILKSLRNFTIPGKVLYEDKETRASLGWIPKTCAPEAYLFACELRNICKQKIGSFEKLQLLETLCCMQVLRTLCFEARFKEKPNMKANGFLGGYSWIVADPNATTKDGLHKIAQSSFEEIEEMLYRVLRIDENTNENNLKEADRHGFKIFRKIAKTIGLVTPKSGSLQRFSLPPQLLRFLVAALVEPGKPVRLTEFYRRVFAHYGIALGDKAISTALLDKNNSFEQKNYVVTPDTAWIEEALKQGGLLIELSDSISIVRNPDHLEI